ncbi:hypothetical protein [Clostridium sp.]|uniref:hypothetical protein n=1 Tax=Clostridium sp. TaxID=1506 RepID=UPI001A3B5425|nr:hypothetical protein [Clostridium sp.]MBK5243232.1 hypothetical protein [Clostridium sp.]
MSDKYMNELIKKFESNFDIEYNRQIGGINFDFAGVFDQRSIKYMVMKAAEVYAYKTHEYVFYKHIDDEFQVTDLVKIKSLLHENVNDIVKMDSEHMASVITFIFSSTESPDLETQKAIRKFKYYKSFLLGFKGWVNVKLIFINSDTNKVITNKFAKGNEKFFSTK